MYPDHPEQGCRIPCIDCTILEPVATPCPTCHGAGMHFQEARMCDASTSRDFGVEAREILEAATEPQQRQQAARAGLRQLVIYGTPFAAGFTDSDLPDDPSAGESMCAALRERLRETWFEARAAER